MIDPATFWTIVIGMGTFIAGQFAFIRYLIVKLTKCQDSRADMLEKQLNVVKTAKKDSEIVGGVR